MPKPYGYMRIDTPDTCYQNLSLYNADYQSFPYDFALSCNSRVVTKHNQGEQYWIDIHYPTLNTSVHCSYKPVQGNLRELSNDALEFVYKNASHANAIPEHPFANPDARVFGVVFDMEGNSATPCQFFLTDSVHHFFRGAVYCNCVPNADSLQPIHDYIREDIYHLVETLRWKY